MMINLQQNTKRSPSKGKTSLLDNSSLFNQTQKNVLKGPLHTQHHFENGEQQNHGNQRGNFINAAVATAVQGGNSGLEYTFYHSQQVSGISQVARDHRKNSQTGASNHKKVPIVGSKSTEKYSGAKSGPGNSNLKQRQTSNAQGSRPDSKGRDSQKRRQQSSSNHQIQGNALKIVSHAAIKGLDQHLAQAQHSIQQHPVFSLKSGNQSTCVPFNNFMSNKAHSKISQNLQRPPAQQKQFFNQTTTLAGLSSHLLDSEEEEESFDPDNEEGQDQKLSVMMQRNSSSRRVKTAYNPPNGRSKGPKGSTQLNGVDNSRHEMFSETQNIDISSLRSLMPLQATHFSSGTGLKGNLSSGSGTTKSTKQKLKTKQRHSITSNVGDPSIKSKHTMGSSQAVLSKQGSQVRPAEFFPNSTKNLNSKLSLSSTNQHVEATASHQSIAQQARLDELINHVRAAAAAAAGYQTSQAVVSSASSSAVGNPILAPSQSSNHSVEKILNISNVSLKRKPSTQALKKQLLPAPAPSAATNTIEVKKLQIKQNVSQQVKSKAQQSQLRDDSKTQQALEMSQSSKRQSMNLPANHEEQSISLQRQVALQQNHLQNQLSSIGDSSLYKNLTQKIIQDQYYINNHNQGEHQVQTGQAVSLQTTASLASAGSSKFNLIAATSISTENGKKSTSQSAKPHQIMMMSNQPHGIVTLGPQHKAGKMQQSDKLATAGLRGKAQTNLNSTSILLQNDQKNNSFGGGYTSSKQLKKQPSQLRQSNKQLLNQTQVIQPSSNTGGMTTSTHKNQKSFAFELLSQNSNPLKKRQGQKSSSNAKKSMNLTSTLPKNLMGHSHQLVQQPIQVKQLKGFDQTLYIQEGPVQSPYKQQLQQQAAQLPVNLRNPAMMATTGNNSNGGINGSNLQCQNVIYSDIRDYNVINTYIGCFPYQQVATQSNIGPNQTLVPNHNNVQVPSSGDMIHLQPQGVRGGAKYTGLSTNGQDTTNDRQVRKNERALSNESSDHAAAATHQQMMMKNYKSQLNHHHQLPQSHPQELSNFEGDDTQPQKGTRRNGHHKTSTLSYTAVLLLNEILQQNNNVTTSNPNAVEMPEQAKSQTRVGSTGAQIVVGNKTPKNGQVNPASQQKLPNAPSVKKSSKQVRAVSSSNPRMACQHAATATIIEDFGESESNRNPCFNFENPQVHNDMKLNKTAKLLNISKILADEEEDEEPIGDGEMHVTSGYGVIQVKDDSVKLSPKVKHLNLAPSSKANLLQKNPITSSPKQKLSNGEGQVVIQNHQIQLSKLKKRQRSRSNGSSSNGCESRSRSFGRVTEDPQQLLQQLHFPITPAKALKLFMSQLTDYEKGEILDYKQVYFLGFGANKIRGSPQQPYNFGYDDERGDYKVVLKDHIGFRFEVIEFLGKGSFGQALKCIDHKTKELVAIKLIRNKKRFQHQAGVELKILMHLKQNDPDDAYNIIRIKDYVVFRKHLVISFELFSINLYDFIKNNNFQGVTLSLIRRFAIQILQALKYLREQNIIHCDLKPENILLRSPDKSGIKVIDFGSSCFQDERIYVYIQSRFYRAPEIILGIPYTPAIDMWSLGCILVELYTGYPIFPGENEQEQLSLIMEMVGLPPDYVLDQATRRKVFFDEETDEPMHVSEDSRGMLRIPGTKSLQGILNCSSQSFVDFIERCLDWDPATRITPYEALLHDWIIEGLPPKVLLHHKRMLGLNEESHHSYRTNSSPSAGMNQPRFDQQQSASHFEAAGHQSQKNINISSSSSQGLVQKPKKALNRTCLVQDALKQQIPSSSSKLMKNSSALNKTGLIQINAKEDLLMYDENLPSNEAVAHRPIPQSHSSKPFQLGLHLKNQGEQPGDLFGDKEKSKTTNMADLLHEIKKTKSSGGPQRQSVGGKMKFENTYDLSKIIKSSFLSQSNNIKDAIHYNGNEECCYMDDDENEEEEEESAPFDEREKNQNESQTSVNGGSNLKKQQKTTQLPFSFLMHNYLKTNAGKQQLQKHMVQQPSHQSKQNNNIVASGNVMMGSSQGKRPQAAAAAVGVKLNNFMSGGHSSLLNKSSEL